MTTTARFGTNLRHARIARDMTQSALAGAAGMDVTEVSRLERGHRDPRLRTITRLAHALELEAGELVASVRAGTAGARVPESPMLIARLIVNAPAERKLAARAISPSEVRQLVSNGALVTRNPHPRVERSRLLIGRTDGGRMLTVVIQPDAADDAAWHVMTGWPASRREIAAYRSAS